MKPRTCIHYYKDGSIKSRGMMLEGKEHGYWKWFRKSGVIMRSGSFEKGKKVGEWISHDKNGKVTKILKLK